jgi:hypothetical protein
MLIVELLLGAKVDVTLKTDAEGKTALELAQDKLSEIRMQNLHKGLS